MPIANLFLHPEPGFPPLDFRGTDGPVAFGGPLTTERLLEAYQLGLFPWYNEHEPVIWWSPDPRAVLFPDELVVARSMRPYFNQGKFRVSFDTCFEEVMRQCANSPRSYAPGGGTWINNDILAGYTGLHKLGFAHSVEVWENEELVGGLYGVAMRNCFFGESMFSHVSNSSKFGFITLVRWLKQRGYTLIDCQQETPHLTSLGARTISRKEFYRLLQKHPFEPEAAGKWVFE